MTRPLLLGHRGARASRHIPENTPASFELCLEQGCDGFEFDVRRSADGQAVICHDPVVRGMDIAYTPAPALALPSLDEVLCSFAKRAFLDIELKVGGLEQSTVSTVRRRAPQKGYVVSSFLPQVLVALHDIDSAIPSGFIFDHPSELHIWQGLPVEWVVPQIEFVREAFVSQVHDAGKKVMVWMVNDADEFKKLADLGVDAIISDDTQLAVDTLPR